MTEYMHLKHAAGRITVAFQVEEKIAKVALAFCSPRDQFSRARGRLISEGRLKADKVALHVTLAEDTRAKEQVQEALMQVLPTLDCYPVARRQAA